MTDFPAGILKAATTTVSKISSLIEDAPTLGAAATEVIAEALMARDVRAASILQEAARQRDSFRVNNGDLLTNHAGDNSFVPAAKIDAALLAIRSGEHP